MIEYNQHTWHTMFYYNHWLKHHFLSPPTVSKKPTSFPTFPCRALQWHHVLTLLEKGRLERLLRDQAVTVHPSSEASSRGVDGKFIDHISPEIRLALLSRWFGSFSSRLLGYVSFVSWRVVCCSTKVDDESINTELPKLMCLGEFI